MSELSKGKRALIMVNVCNLLTESHIYVIYDRHDE